MVPVFKKGNGSDPACYRPLSLIDATAKLLGRVVLARLETWATDTGVMARTQYGCRRGMGGTEQCLNLSLIMGKYMKARRGSIHLAFMDLSSAFDTVNREKLWALMGKMGVEEALISLLRRLHASTRYGPQGKKTRPIVSTEGVRQGYILAPFLF